MAASRGPLYPLRFKPIFRDYPWGGRAIGEQRAGVFVAPINITRHAIAAGHQDLVIVCVGGDITGRQWLSIQVHPGDDYALAHEGDHGKTEMWVVLAATAGAELLLGFKRGIDRRAFRQAILDGSAVDWLHRTRVRPGDVFFVPPGTIHAIGPGVLIAEIQQSSNVTYRVFDWNREPQRPLHVERSLAVLDFEAVEVGPVVPVPTPQSDAELLAECPYFRTERITLQAEAEIAGQLTGETFEIWGCTAGSASVIGDFESTRLQAVSWLLLPAALGGFRVAADEPTTLLRISTPAPV